MLNSQSIIRLVLKVPWWGYVILAALVYLLMKYAAPMIESENTVLITFSRLGPTFAPFGSLIFLLLAPISLYEGTERKEWVWEQQDLSDTIGEEWRDSDQKNGIENSGEEKGNN